MEDRGLEKQLLFPLRYGRPSMVRTCTQFLDKPVFVIKMNFNQKKWSTEQRLRWLQILRYACEQTITAIDQEVRLHGDSTTPVQ